MACDISRDKKAAEDAARRVHTNMQLGDFAAVYREAHPRLKATSTESDFVDFYVQLQRDFGTLKEAHEIAYERRVDSRIGRLNALMFELEYERGRLYEKMILIRSPEGEMQVWKMGTGSERSEIWAYQ